MKSPTWELNFPSEDAAALFSGPPRVPESRSRWRVDAAELAVTERQVARYFGGPRYVPNRRRRQEILDGMEQAAALVEPAAVRAVLRVTATRRDRCIQLSTGEWLPVPRTHAADPDRPDCPHLEDTGETSLEPMAEFIPGPTGSRASADDTAVFDRKPVHLAAVLGTLGPGLERRCRELSGQGCLFQATLLDAVGTAMLDRLGIHLRRRLQREAAQTGRFLGPRFSPGLGSYPMEAQTLLHRWSGAESLGVTLNASFILEPVKSISFFSLISSTPGPAPARNKCSECSLRHCQFRTAQRHGDVPTRIPKSFPGIPECHEPFNRHREEPPWPNRC